MKDVSDISSALREGDGEAAGRGFAGPVLVAAATDRAAQRDRKDVNLGKALERFHRCVQARHSASRDCLACELFALVVSEDPPAP
jgi:hypothetical protein